MKIMSAENLMHYIGNGDLVCEKVGLLNYRIRCLSDNKILVQGVKLKKYLGGIIKVMYNGPNKRNCTSITIESDLYTKTLGVDGQIIGNVGQFIICEVKR